MTSFAMTSRAAVLASGAALATAAGLLAPDLALAAAPPTPTRLHVSTSTGGASLTWSASGAGHFQIQQASDRGFRTNVHTYTDRDGRDRQFSAPSITPGSTYYWRIRAFSGSSASRWTAPVSATVTDPLLGVRVASYNVIESSADGSIESGNRIAPWSQRVGGVVSLLRQTGASVFGLQEAAGWVGGVRGARQADDVVSKLGRPWVLARTEVPPNEPHYFRTGVYVAYDGSRYAAVAEGGHWNIGNTRWAAYQLLQDRVTGARFLFTSTHETTAGGSSGDSLRQTETKNLIADATRYAASHGSVPVVYVGDFNSHDGHNHVFDGPGQAMRAAHIADAFKSAVTRVNAGYDSANLYLRTPPKTGRSLDRIFAPAGVGIASWRLTINLKNGKFVGVIPSDHNPIAADLTLPY
jgi:endonuclease/exonuclease/phosphatase family metal-dependent hydrolase